MSEPSWRANLPLARNAGAEQAGLLIMIVDDCRLYREGLASILDKEPDVRAIYSAQDARSFVAVIDTEYPHVVLVNLATWHSQDLITSLRRLSPSSLIIAIGVGESDQEIIACAEAGVSGYLLRSEPFQQLMTLVRSVVAGETVCSPRASAALMRRLAKLAEDRLTQARKVPVLTDREDQILGFLDNGLSNQQIADRLGIELRTVKNHVHHILAKLGVSRRGEAVAAMRSLRGNDPLSLASASAG